MSAVHVPCGRCNRPVIAKGDRDVAGFALCDACPEYLTGDDQGAGSHLPPRVTPAGDFGENLVAPRRHRRRSARRKSDVEGRRTPWGAFREPPPCPRLHPRV